MSADKSIERDLTTRIKALSKAVSSNEPVPAIIAIMETLKKGAAPSEEVLRVGDGREELSRDYAFLYG